MRHAKSPAQPKKEHRKRRSYEAADPGTPPVGTGWANFSWADLGLWPRRFPPEDSGRSCIFLTLTRPMWHRRLARAVEPKRCSPCCLSAYTGSMGPKIIMVDGVGDVILSSAASVLKATSHGRKVDATRNIEERPIHNSFELHAPFAVSCTSDGINCL